MKPILEARGMRSGRDFFLAYSPEREDPGNTAFSTTVITKVIGGDGADELSLAGALYSAFVPVTIPVSSPDTAEAVKLSENIFRAVNIAPGERAQAHLRGHGHRCMGGHRCSQDQTLRLHAVLSRTRPRRSLHSDRPVLSDLEGAGVRAAHPLHRARRRDERATWSPASRTSSTGAPGVA
jgi:hypothetical protein